VRRVGILTYHTLDDSGSVLSVAPKTFADHLAILRDLPVKVVPLADIPRALATADTGDDVLAITFDDGFETVYRHAYPLLHRYGFPATVFLVTDYCGGTNAWPGQSRLAPRASLLDWAQIKEMAGDGIAFGSHTRSHPDLTALSPQQAEAELTGSRKAIEDAIGGPVDAFAYPYGAYDAAVRALAASHYRVACTADLGFVEPEVDILELPRLDVYYLRQPALFARMLSAQIGAYVTVRRQLRSVKRRVLSRLKRA
jgi:peptidoglycan/xylan/chitin deacetylase (PgdA/CDA1 family)